ncbi:DUF2145 domain-containing protein [Ideonella sp. 4Y16]|uniref:DUF2145 domain-containing protein n=1 Tax=Ideonella alba TaxID=2824118 RepID=A0A940Y5E3_9BURK|nr:DUF2145 domain-containing protein [Ideonella alba]MBQ0930519.1 DUF2145 domain-containing protein [Ideonella alba]MBQ0945229.1 DUF2145 domain-containing protein [Ideonella alba]
MAWRRALAAGALALLCASAVQARWSVWCSQPLQPNATQHDRLLRFGAVLRERLRQSTAPAVLVSRSGTNLHWLGQRYSHAGVALRDNPLAPWAVRQLYFACEEQRSRVFDQGLPGFLLDFADPDEGYVSLLLLPPEAASALARAALDETSALGVLEPRYNAASYPFDLSDQNCNQWLLELMARAWGAPPGRAGAQAWLAEAGYRPAHVETGALQGLAPFIPWVRGGGQPRETLQQGVWQVSLPSSIEDFVRQRYPQARRIELCHDGRRVVLRENGPPIADGCRPAPGDVLTPLD